MTGIFTLLPPVAQLVKNLPANTVNKRHEFNPWVRKIPWRRKRQSTPAFLPEEFHGQRNLAGYSPWVCKESDRTKWLILSLYCRRVICFQLIFIHSAGYGSEFIFFFCMQTPNCSSIICWKRIALSCPVVCLYGCISTPLICLFLYQSHTVLVTVVSQSWFRYCQSSNVAAVLRSCQLLCIFCMSIPIL